ncbi:MAG TPA: hypothetical protein VGF94_06005 [Kofleriaceae bacterium]|jgi:hypothetical protein
MKLLVSFILGVACALGGCSKQVNECHGDSDCKDPAYPFCDVDGEYAASGGEKNVCTIVPPDCPASRCGCTPGNADSCTAGVAQVCGADGMSETAVTCAAGCSGDKMGCVACSPGAGVSCSDNQAIECAADGMSQRIATCSLGCSSDGTRCQTFTPSNGLAGALMMATASPDVVLPAGTKIDVDLGTVEDGMGNSIAIPSVLVPQTNGPNIRAFYAGSFTTQDVTVTGSAALALVAAGPVTIGGLVDVSGHAATAGAGAQESPAACVGADTQTSSCGGTNNTADLGPGGAGHATAGGTGGGLNMPGEAGGAAFVGFSPLVGGCRGGSFDVGSTVLQSGGGGGGAIQLVSLDSVAMTGNGTLDVGGGGGEGGGGSAGTIVIEAPRVQINGASTGVFANGGAAGCGTDGDGTLTSQAAQCSGGGAAGAVPGFFPGSGSVCIAGGGVFCASCGSFYRGGGGASGLARIATKDGTYSVLDGAVISVGITTGVLVPE